MRTCGNSCLNYPYFPCYLREKPRAEVFLLCLTQHWTMMERRRALTIPFKVDKDNLVPWTAFAGCKRRHSDSTHKNGSTLFEHITLEMSRRKPCLILTDVLKTEKGQAYIERIRRRTLGNQGQVYTSTQRESGRCREESLISRDLRPKNDKIKSITPKSNQKTTSSPAQRSRLRRSSQNVDDEVDKEEQKDIKEVIIGTDNGDDFKFAEVVDCGLSVSWEPAEDRGSCDEFPRTRMKDRWTDPEKEVQHSSKRKRKDAGSHCNGTGSPKRHRESVLRLTGEDGRDGGPASTHIYLEESGEDVDLDSLDRTIVQFTVGADDQTEVLVPIISPDVEAGDFIGTPQQNLSSSQDNTAANSPYEPIVLSSDDEGSHDAPRPCSTVGQTLVTVEDEVIQSESLQEALDEEQEASNIQDMQVLHVVVNLPPSVAVPPTTSMDYSFSTLHYGGYQAKSNGDMMILDQEIIIPVTDDDEQLGVMLTLERKELRRYSVWDQQELEDRQFLFQGSNEPFPVAVLLFCVSEMAAAAIKQDLLKLCLNQDRTTNTDKVSPFILLTLRHPVEGMEGALLRSLLDIDCLNSLADAKSIHCADGVSCLEDFQSPVLSLDESIDLIRKTGLDSHLLSLLDLESTDPRLDTDQDTSHSDTDRNTPPLIQLEVDSQKETLPELETAAEQDTGSNLEPEEDQKEKELENPSEKRKEEPPPVYTVCHRRTKGSYSVSLCKPDSSWAKYKHQGQARRLIQFPPPPLKGGITVTMEDLQCLDTGHFLNDVIIDFYLKYLLQKAPASVAERSHIFSSFFYKQLTRRDNASEGVVTDSCQRQRRHQRVKTWTRHVDIFEKDFVFVPVNQEAHWYLVVICFPGLEEPKSEAWSGPNDEGQEQEVAKGSKSPNENTETPPTPPTLNHSDSMATQTEKPQEQSTKDPAPGPVNCTERTYKKKTICKRPCILIMDSLKLSLHERVFKLLREYLQSEWEARRGSTRDFVPDQIQSSHCKVPLQDNSSDCGLYLLQYVESFLQDPVVHFDLPLQLQQWFPRQQVRRKRDDIRDLVLNLYRKQHMDGNR
ncbi:sentrin-specific protease 7 isoform X2 [Centropristis striata]|uniref:sentrin-specific protease 7 isoform X2 n=1 Tax=Centropristis striata TaxID=184440 RepID=UPI0027E0C581|nr:sentrin-specific protease 7 isoform X2 [Centropristis striata]